MAVKDSVLNFVIKAKNLASDAVSKFRKDVETLDATSADAGKSVDSLGTATDNLGKDASAASSGTKTLNSALDGVSTNANDAAQSLERADDSIDGIASSANASAAAADKAGTAASKLAQRYNAAGKPIETARQEIKKSNDELKNVDAASGKAGVSIGSFIKRIVALGAAAFGIKTVVTNLRDMLGVGDQFERLGLQMQQVMGSIDSGKKATEWIKTFAKDTPLQLEQVTETFVALKNFGLDPQTGAMQAIVDQAAKLGKGYEAVEGISHALGKAWGKQKLQGEEINTLIERGVPVWELLAKVTGKNTAELQKMSEAGLLGRDTIKAMIDEMGKQSAGAAAQNMSLLSGYVSNVTDEWQLFQNMIAESGALDYAKDQLRQLIDTIQEMKATGELKEWAQRISDGFIAVAETSKAVVLAIKDNIGTIALLAKAYAAVKLADFANDAKNLAVSLGTTLVGGTNAAATATKTLGTAMRALPWLVVIDQVIKAFQAYSLLAKAKVALGLSQKTESKVMADAAARIAEFNEQTGLTVQTLDELLAMQIAGSVAVDEYTGKWRLATDQITEAEKAERAHAEAMKKTDAERKIYLEQLGALEKKYDEVKNKSNDVAVAIADIGKQAMQEGGGGMAAFATILQSVAFEGKATKEELQNGLAKLLASLSADEYQKFGPGIITALDNIKEGTINTTAALGSMKSVISDDLTTAANKLGVDVSKILTGIDQESAAAIGAFEELATAVKETGIKGEGANTILKEGLLDTLKKMDTSKEIDATVASINRLVELGKLTKTQGEEAIALAEKRRQQILTNADAQNTATDANKEAAESWGLISAEVIKSSETLQGAGSVAKWLQDVYYELRGEIEALGPAAVAAFDKLQGVNPNTDFLRDEFGELKQAISDSTNEIDRLQKLASGADFTGINRYLRETITNAETVKKEYAEQKLSLERLQQAYANGAISARQFINAASGAASSTSLLNQADLSALKNQIKSAQDQMESFRSSTLGTLNSLQSELANLQGNADRVAQLAYEARLTDLTAQLEAAKKTGDKDAIANAQQALKIAQDIYNIKKQQIAEEKKAQEAAQEKARIDEAARRVEETKQPTAQPLTQQQPTQQTTNVQRLEIALPSGKTANLSGSPDDVNALLDFLNQAGMRSLQ